MGIIPGPEAGFWEAGGLTFMGPRPQGNALDSRTHRAKSTAPDGRDYCFNCFSIAAITSFESGVTSGSKR